MERNELSDRITALGDAVVAEYPDAAGLLYTVATTVITAQDKNFLRRIDPLVKELLLVTKLAKAMEGTEKDEKHETPS